MAASSARASTAVWRACLPRNGGRAAAPDWMHVARDKRESGCLPVACRSLEAGELFNVLFERLEDLMGE